MKVEQAQKEFTPITITLETCDEYNKFIQWLDDARRYTDTGGILRNNWNDITSLRNKIMARAAS